MESIPTNEKGWKEKLSKEEYRVLREAGTEAPFIGAYVHTHEDGTYRCRGCAALLFSSDTKFDSGSGWPSFTDTANTLNVGTRADDTLGMHRTEVFCKNCGSHLGHLFNDGPKEAGGKRFCINSIALEFKNETQ